MTPASAWGQGSGAVVRALSDIETHNLTDDLQVLVAWSASLQPVTGATQKLTQAQALANVRAFLGRQTAPEQWTALRSDPNARTVRALQGLAAAAVAGGKPTAALAALLLAQEKDPKDRMVLINLAGLLAPLGMPREALALLDAADQATGRLPAVMGIPARAIALNNRGYACIVLGQWAEAKVPLEQAMQMAPLLYEAARNLALVLHHLGREDDAKRVLYFGVWRSRGPTEEPRGVKEEPGDGDPATVPASPAEVPLSVLDKVLRRRVRDVFDLSAGLGTNLSAVHHPVNAAEAKGFDAMIRRRNPKMTAELLGLTQRFGQLNAQLRQRPKSLNRWRSERILALITGYAPARDVEVKALHEITQRTQNKLMADVSSRGQELGRKKLDLIKGGANTPANMIRVHNEYVDGIHQMAVRYEGAWREEWSAEYKYLTGLAANLGDPGWHELAVLHIRIKEQNAQTMLLGMVGAAYAPGAYIPSKDLQDLEDSAGQNVPACPESLKRRSLEVDLEIFSVSFSCAEVEVEVGTEGLLGAFAKVVYARGGEITVMLGPTAEIGGGFAVEDGLYITVDNEGVKDLGFRVTFEQGLPVGPGLTMTTELDSMDFSFVPAAPLESSAR